MEIFSALGIYQEAVRMALDISPKLAKRVVKRSIGDGLHDGLDVEERKRLWQMIAK